MNKKFNQIFINYEKFKELILNPLNDLENNPIYYQDNNQVYSFEKIFNYLNEWYGDEYHKYDNDDIFITKFKYLFNQIYPSFFFKFKEQESLALDQLKDDWFNNISKSSSQMIGSNNSTNESRISEAPTSQIFNDILDTIPLTNAQKDDISNAITNNETNEAYLINKYNLYLKKKKADFDNILNEFLDQFYFMFISYEINDIDNKNNDLIRFANGYVVNEVDYLGLENSQRIDSLLSKINLNSQNIVSMNNRKQDKLIAGNGINIIDNVISSTGGSGKEYIGERPIIIEENKIKLDTIFVNDARTFSWWYDDYGDSAIFNGKHIYLDNYGNKNGVAITGLKVTDDNDCAVNLKWVKDYVANNSSTPSDYQEVKQQVETNKQDITNLKTKDTQQDNAIALNQQKIEAIKSLDNLVAGDNVVLSPQGDSEVFINTSDNLTLKSITARDGTIEIESTAHFKQTPHIKQSLFIDNENLKKSSEIAMLDNDLKIVNGNGDILLADKTGVINTRTLKDNQDKIIEGLDGSLIWKKKGIWNAQTTYQRYDVVTHKNDSYWLDKDTSIGEEPSPKNSFWIDLTPQTTPTYSKEVIDSKFETTNTNVSNNTNEINDLKLKHQLNQQLINDIGINHKFTIDPLQSANWELGIVYSELDPTDPSKSTIKIVPSTLKEYQLKHSLTTFANDIALVKSELKDILTSANKDTIKQLFYGQEDKDQDPRTYGYITSYGTIPLQKQVGVRTFGNIFNVDYNEWNGVFYNNVKIPFGTKNDSLGIDLTENNFKSNTNIQNITLYKEVVNDGITETEVNEKLKSYATNESVDSKDSLILQEAKDYGDSLKPQIMDLNGGDFIWSDSYALYYKEVKPSQIPFNKVISYSIWSTNNIGKNDFNGLALTAFVRQISSGGFNVYIMNNSNKISAINEFKVRISYFK